MNVTPLLPCVKPSSRSIARKQRDQSADYPCEQRCRARVHGSHKRDGRDSFPRLPPARRLQLSCGLAALRSGLDIKLDHGVDNLAMAMSLVASTRGLALMPAYAQNLLPPSVVSRPLEGEAPDDRPSRRLQQVERIAGSRAVPIAARRTGETRAVKRQRGGEGVTRNTERRCRRNHIPAEKSGSLA